MGQAAPTYPSIRQPYAYHAKDADELSDALSSLYANETDELIAARRAWATGWCGFFGQEAEDRLGEVLAEVQTKGPGATWLLNGWNI
jgi:hypothetical protein